MTRNPKRATQQAVVNPPDHKEKTMAEQTPVVESPEQSASKEEALALMEKTTKTRGKGAREVKYKALNRVPLTTDEFQALLNPSLEDVCNYLYVGYNEVAQGAASDEIGEYIEDNWTKEEQQQFRLVVRNQFKMMAGLETIEEIATRLHDKLKPVIDARRATEVAAAEAAAEAAKTPAVAAPAA